MSYENAAQRLKRNVRHLLDTHGEGPQKRTRAGLGKALDLKANGISTILNAEDVPHFKMRDLDKIAGYFGVPASMLIAEPGAELWELRPTEMRLMRIWREWPIEIQDAAMALLAYFASLSPAEKEVQRMLSKMRRLSKNDREYIDRTIEDVLRAKRAEPRTQSGGGTVPAAPVSSPATTPPTRARR